MQTGFAYITKFTFKEWFSKDFIFQWHIQSFNDNLREDLEIFHLNHTIRFLKTLDMLPSEKIVLLKQHINFNIISIVSFYGFSLTHHCWFTFLTQPAVNIAENKIDT